MTQWVILGVVASLLLVLGVTVFFHVRHISLEEADRLRENDAIARSVAAFIEVREQGYLNTLLAYAGRFRFREAVERNDRAEALVHLRQLGQTFPELDRVFLTNPAGVMWAIYPEAPQVLGRSFAHRDWYQGVSRGWRPYMSEVFQSSRDGALVVGLTVPIRSQEGRVIGIIGSFQRLEVIRQWLLPIQIPDGDLYLVDRKGQFIFHRTRIGPERLSDYARIPVVERLLRGEEGVAETGNPAEGQVRLSAYRLLPSLGWGVVVQRDKNLALLGARTLVLVSGTAGLLLAAALFVLAVVAVGNDRRRRAALSALEEKTRQLKEVQEELVRKERLAVLGQLAGGVAHELRNPLGVVKNSVYYLKMVLPEEEERVRKHLQILEREVGTAGRIVTDLLDFARVQPPVRSATDLSGLVGAVLERTPIGDHIDVLTDLAADLPSISVD
ncbi:MAG: cache domain-containing protein, partial [Candidatus Rokuibacteriota bacterium]